MDNDYRRRQEELVPFFLRPSQVVIYTEDMEPITVVDMKPAWWDFIEKNRRIRFAVIEPYNAAAYTLSNHVYIEPKEVTVEAHMIVNMIVNMQRRAKYLMLTTPNETTALLLDSTFLPGQRRTLNREKQSAFARGFLEALKQRI